MIKSVLMTIGSVIICSQSYSFTITVDASEISNDSLVDIHVHKVNKNCKPKKCDETKLDVNGIPIQYFNEVMQDLKNDPANKLTEFSLGLNGNSLPSCNHLEQKYGQNINIKFSQSGCQKI